jgi:pimeloyl-ACP methyl ester carboxylesterase
MTGACLAPQPPHCLAADPRFGYALCRPPDAGGKRPGLLVAVHDSVRRYRECLDAFADFARANHLVGLAPLFPAGLAGDEQGDGYKRLQQHEIRHDRLLDAMIEETVAATGCNGARFLLYGYSGGGQFAHRYLLLHPARVRAAVIGAPGQVTLADEACDWPAGMRDSAARFGRALDRVALRQVPVELLVGALDTRRDDLREQPPCGAAWPGDAHRQPNRIERLRAFERSLHAVGAEPRFTTMPGVDHGQGWHAAPAFAQRFFAAHLPAVPDA